MEHAPKKLRISPAHGWTYLQEADRVNIETGVTPTAAIRKYPLLYAFFRAHRQLSKLRECLLLQVTRPLLSQCLVLYVELSIID